MKTESKHTVKVFFLMALLLAGTLLFGQSDSTGNSGDVSGDEVKTFLAILFGILDMLGVHITGGIKTILLLILPAIWTWYHMRQAKKVARYNAAIAVKNASLPQGEGEQPKEYKGLFKRFISLFRKKK